MINSLKNEKVGVFIDLNYLLAVSRHLNQKIDFVRFRELLTSGSKECHIFIYCTKLPDQFLDSARKVAEFLYHNGFEVTSKEIDVIERPYKTEYIGDIDVLMSVDILYRFFSLDLDTVVVASNKLDLRYPLEHIQDQDGRVVLMGTNHTPKKYLSMSDILVSQVDEYVLVEDILDTISFEEPFYTPVR